MSETGNIENPRRTHTNLAKRTHEMLRDLGQKDDLTGLYNRRGLLTATENIRRTLIRESHFLDFNVMVLDLINLKGLNNKYGYSGANEILIKAARHLSEKMSRPTDIVGRLSGDEYVAISLNSEQGKLESVVQEIVEEAPENVSFNIAYKHFDMDTPIPDALKEVVDKIDKVKKMGPIDATGRAIGNGNVVDLDKTSV